MDSKDKLVTLEDLKVVHDGVEALETRMTSAEADIIDTVKKSTGGTFDGNVQIDREDGTTSSRGWSTLEVGNNTAEGSNGNSTGLLRVWGATDKKTDIYHASTTPTANQDLILPDASGTIALTKDVGFINKGHISIGGALTDIENWIKSNFASNRWVVARVTPTSSGYFGSSSFDIMANCSSANYGWGYCHSDNPAADGHLYFRLGSGQFFWKKVMMCPADTPATSLGNQNFFTPVTGVTVQGKAFLCTTSIAYVYLNLRKTDSTAFGWGRTNVGTLASGYRPWAVVAGFTGCGSDAVDSYPNRNIYANIYTDGTIFVDNFNNDTKSFYIRGMYFYN